MSDQPFRLLTLDEIEAWWNDPANKDARAFPRTMNHCPIAVALAETNDALVLVRTRKGNALADVICGHEPGLLPLPDDLDQMARAFDRHKASPEGMAARDVAKWMRRYRERQAEKAVTA